MKRQEDVVTSISSVDILMHGRLQPHSWYGNAQRTNVFTRELKYSLKIVSNSLISFERTFQSTIRRRSSKRMVQVYEPYLHERTIRSKYYFNDGEYENQDLRNRNSVSIVKKPILRIV